ncbi:penicillin-binding protein 1A [Flexithrix dorotheae]|uniref:penicillin-binding protein 1A n=1 Tax=Flexithrix dorotheae TaxID=70993 RepID=UPI00037144DD|nr:transglycosylase domain-containing protein [Flexithrix dorotheae]
MNRKITTFFKLFLLKFNSFKSKSGEYFKGKSIFKKTSVTLAGIFGLISLGVITLFLLVFFGFFGPLPSKEELKKVENANASKIYDENGRLLGKYYLQNRSNVSYEAIPDHVKNALIATEDARFNEHSGIDFRSLARVAVKNILMGQRSAGGGSTITQQLAKNLFQREENGAFGLVISKFKEMILARRFESIYDKNQIITLYLNTVPFGENTFGIEEASRLYFNKPASAISIDEGAILVGMLKANYYFNPRLFPDKSMERRNTVFSQMEKYGYLDRLKQDSLSSLPIKLDYTPPLHSEGLATYFRENIRKEVEEICKNIKDENGEPYNIYTDGLKIYTSIDFNMQKYAEEAINTHISELQKTFQNDWNGSFPWSKSPELIQFLIEKSERYAAHKKQKLAEEEIEKIFNTPQKISVFSWEGDREVEMSPKDSILYYLNFLQSGMLAMEPQSGKIKAWVGGINHKYFKYDHVNYHTKRQVGSVFKPIVYAAALENGYKPCEYYSNKKETYEEYDDWSPRNANNEYEGSYALHGALAHSVNTVSVKLILDSGIPKTTALAQKMGIQSELDTVPALALGAADISLLEMVTAYCAFANGGKRVEPTYLLKIENSNGEIIYEPKELKHNDKVLSYETAQLMTQMMKGVVNYGTANSLRTQYGLQNDIAGKTGTTQNHADGWFIGITPKLVTGVWTGGEFPSVHFRSLRAGQGANSALPAFGLFYQKLNQNPDYKSVSWAKFPQPSEEVMDQLDCPGFKPKEVFLEKIMTIFFKNDNSPKKKDKPKKKLFKPSTWGKKKN